MLVWAETGRLAAALNGTLAKHGLSKGMNQLIISMTTVSRVVALADSVRLDVEMSLLPSLVPFKSNSLHAHTHILNAVFNYVSSSSFFSLPPFLLYFLPFFMHRSLITYSEHVMIMIKRVSGIDGVCVVYGLSIVSSISYYGHNLYEDGR